MFKDGKKDSIFDLIESKKSDLIASIIEKVFDGLLKSLPKILEKLFGNGLYELLSFNNEYDYKGSYYNSVYDTTSDLKKLLSNFGLFGYGPLVFLKIIDGITAFVKILKKNKFFKNFLIPAGVILLIAGAAVFLVWWLQYDSYSYEHYGGYDVSNDYPQYSYNSNKYDQSYNNMKYGGHEISNYYPPYQPPQYMYNSVKYDHNNDISYQPYANHQIYNRNRDAYGGKQYHRSYYDA